MAPARRVSQFHGPWSAVNQYVHAVVNKGEQRNVNSLSLQLHHLVCCLAAANIPPEWYVVKPKKYVASEIALPCTLGNPPVPTSRSSQYRVDTLIVMNGRLWRPLCFFQMLHYRFARHIRESSSDISELVQIGLTCSQAPCLGVECRSHGFLSSSPCDSTVCIGGREWPSVWETHGSSRDAVYTTHWLLSLETLFFLCFGTGQIGDRDQSVGAVRRSSACPSDGSKSRVIHRLQKFRTAQVAVCPEDEP